MSEREFSYNDCFARILDDGSVELGNSTFSHRRLPALLLPPALRPPETPLPPPFDSGNYNPDIYPAEIAFDKLFGEGLPEETVREPLPRLGESPIFGIFEDAVLTTGLQVTIQLFSPAKGTEILRDYVVYPEVAGVESAVRVRSLCLPLRDWRGQMRRDRLDFFPADMAGRNIACLTFRARTDTHNTPANITETEAREDGSVALNGNIIAVAPAESGGEGFVLVKFSPAVEDRRDDISGDFMVHPYGVEVLGYGIAPHEIRPVWQKSYSVAWIPYRGSMTDALIALRKFLLKRWSFGTASEPVVMVNPWGGGQGVLHDELCEDFLRNEISSVPAVGGECYQIDDGWQAGGTLEDVFHGYATPDFWRFDEKKFPGGIASLLPYAAHYGVRLGLWLAPNSNLQFTDWESAAEKYIELIDEGGFKYLKIDGVFCRSYEAEQNLHFLLETIVRRRPEVRLNIDVTNGVRPGFLYSPAFGQVFLENRYCRYLFDRSSQEIYPEYFPYRVLRNAWNLSRWLPPRLLQVSIPDIHRVGAKVFRRHKGLLDGYPESPLTADHYGQAYCAAIALFFSPLLWLKPSKMQAVHARELKEIIDLHKKIRRELWEGVTLPFGDEPDGKSWSGFQSCGRHGQGYILVFRDNHRKKEMIFDMPFTLGRRVTRIAGKGTVLVARENSLHVKMPEPRSWGLWKVYG